MSKLDRITNLPNGAYLVEFWTARRHSASPCRDAARPSRRGDRVRYAPAFAADPGDLDFWRDNDTVEMIGSPIEFERSTDVKSKVRCRLLQDFGGRNGYPRAIDLHLVVAIDLSP
jgi:hypothetical protein